jgi:LuxR family maltose regulon positive regulatory protein
MRMCGCLPSPIRCSHGWREAAPSAFSSSEGAQFSPREFEVLEELLQGRSNKEIARALDMTEHTVKFHLKNIFGKLKVERRTQAIARARELGLG